MYPRHAYYKLQAVSLLFVTTIVLVVVSLSLTFTARTTFAASAHVDVMVLNTEISPASLRFLTKTIATAEGDGAQALVIEIDTPGGSIDAMKSMTEAELSS